MLRYSRQAARLLACFIVASCAAVAQTTIQDTIRVGAANALFRGWLRITAPSMVCGSISYAQWPLEVRVDAGVVNVSLAATATCEPQGVYTVRFVPDKGSEWTEKWIVPSSATPITLSQIPRAASPVPTTFIPPAQLSRAGGGVGQVLTILPSGIWGPAAPTGGGPTAALGGDLAGTIGSATVQRLRGVDVDATAPTDGQVYAYDAALGRLLPRTLNGAYADSEVPAGDVNGANAEFTLQQIPFPPASLQLYRNGILQKRGAGGDYNLSGATITFVPAAVPVSGDLIQASYRWAPSLPFGSQVLSVAGKSGAVALDAADVAGLGDELAAKAPIGHTHDLDYPSLSGAYADPDWITSLSWSKISGIGGTPSGAKYLRDDGTWQPLPAAAAATWGAILGDITVQADLASALAGKAAAAHGHNLTSLSGSIGDAQVPASAVTQHQAALSIGWSQVTSAPATYAPAAHTHAAGDLPKLRHIIDFAGQTELTIASATHGLPGPIYAVSCYNSSATPGTYRAEDVDQVEIDAATLAITIKFHAAFTGRCLIQ